MPSSAAWEECVTKNRRSVIETESVDELQRLLGIYDKNLSIIAQELSLAAHVEGLKIVLEGNEADVAAGEETLKSLLELLRSGETVDRGRIVYSIELAREGHAKDIASVMNGIVAITARGKPVKCKTVGQKEYVDAAKKNTVTFGVGPAGTGKTYLAVCLAVSALKSRQVERIVLTRPAVEAGEKLGFLPGDLQTKVDPYLRPLYDALQELLGMDSYPKYIERGIIEIAPLAYMRGRTLSNAFIILDEAQNTTKEQMKMFLTRMGEGSRMIVTGDLTQVDLPEGRRSGLEHAVHILQGVEDIAVCRLTAKDVVRHPLVMRIIRAYENEGMRAEGGNDK